ncbi:IDEAL domain-containing protein [Bacillus chungangensis]|uniref:Uncharacterized protein YpiB (UPF0302 family) n=1 Tax=Bacillus chungangensis TaxID=587633 RepID=A0ABT9WNA7_9BACI|nr:IDEAL domain-containing protein [Bacillus chungangensis]MDQ0174719.1 uncharacterized protein YpiB (UPF0302 family) [Bacillus chungangensis]
MENKKSYKELMKEYEMSQNQAEKTLTVEAYIDRLLNNILLEKQKDALLHKIDLALDEKDFDAFMALSAKLNNLLENNNNQKADSL